MINIALAKGRLAEDMIAQFEEIGILFPTYSKKSRKLIFKDQTNTKSIVLVKPTDVAVYVEKGACDIGVVGKDSLMENQPDVYEILDLGYGKCRFVVAGPNDYQKTSNQKLKVATKYPNVAKTYFQSIGQPVETIKINGSVELAPLMGLSDLIVDITETGATLKENGLSVIAEIADVSARLIVNKVSLKTKQDDITDLIGKLKTRGNEHADDQN